MKTKLLLLLLALAIILIAVQFGKTSQPSAILPTAGKSQTQLTQELFNFFEEVPLARATFMNKKLDSILGLLFVMQQHENDCAVFSDLNWKFDSETGWTLEESIFDDKTILGFYKQFERCVNSGARFIVITFALMIDPNSSINHQNALILDTVKMEAELFEPHGYERDSLKQYVHEDRYNLVQLYLQVLPAFLKDLGYRFLSPVDWCPRTGPQSKAMELFNIGLCQAWSLWWIDLRLTYPNLSREELFNSMMDLYDENPGALGRYIEKYVAYIETGKRKIYDDIVRKLSKEESERLQKAIQTYYINAYVQNRLNKLKRALLSGKWSPKEKIEIQMEHDGKNIPVVIWDKSSQKQPLTVVETGIQESELKMIKSFILITDTVIPFLEIAVKNYYKEKLSVYLKSLRKTSL